MAGTQSVTMPETESLPRDIHDIRLLEYDDSHLLEIMIAPDVMVPLKEIHFHAIVHEVHQRSEHTHLQSNGCHCQEVKTCLVLALLSCGSLAYPDFCIIQQDGGDKDIDILRI